MRAPTGDPTALPRRDPDTGAINEALLLEAAAPMVSLARRNARTMAFMHIHVQGLRDRLADTPDSGALLFDVTERITTAVRDSDFVARVEPDRYVVTLTEVWEADAAVRVGHRLVRALGSDGAGFVPCVGVSFFPHDGDTLEVLLSRARSAVPDPTEETVIGFADPIMGAGALRRAGLERDLRGEDAHNQFLLHYQPIFSTATGSVVGVEALIRWDHATQGLLPARDFVPLAERTGRIRALDHWAVQQAIRDARAWHQRGWGGWVSVNLSARTITDPLLVDHVAKEIAANGGDPSSLVFEVTESAALKAEGEALRVLDGLRDLGASVAVDDFGTGYASFEYLRDFDPDIVKLDRVFVTGGGDPRHLRLLDSLVLMAHHMGKPVVVEGLEEEHQREWLIDSGCDMVQGYLLGSPVPASELQGLHLEPGLV